MLTTVLEV